jgi:hypothetical protein
VQAGDQALEAARPERDLLDAQVAASPLLRDRRRFRLAEPLYLQALAIYEGRGNTARVDEIRTRLATLYTTFGELAETDRYR